MGKKKVVEIVITLSGSKKFKQGIVDKIAELLFSDEVPHAKPGDCFRFESDIEPSEEVMP